MYVDFSPYEFSSSIFHSFVQRAITDLVLDPAMVDRESWNITLAAIESMLVGRTIFPDKKPLPLHTQAASFQERRPSAILMSGLQPLGGRAAIQHSPVTKDASRSNAQKALPHSQPHSRRSNVQKIAHIDTTPSSFFRYRVLEGAHQPEHLTGVVRDAVSVDSSCDAPDARLQLLQLRPQSASLSVAQEHPSLGPKQRSKSFGKETQVPCSSTFTILHKSPSLSSHQS